MKKKIITTTVLGVMLIALVSSCEKNITLILKPQTEVITDTVSFSKDLVPIFTANCAISGCHATGGHTPDLTAERAYNSLISGGYVDVADPESSVLYQRLTGTLSPAMPMGKPGNPSNINALVLAWIKQGAKKN